MTRLNSCRARIKSSSIRFIGGITLLVILASEVAQQLFAHTLSHWISSGVTIILGSAAAIVTTCLVLNREQILSQSLSTIALSFVEAENFDNALTEAIEEIGRITRCDAALLFLRKGNENIFLKKAEWVSSDIKISFEDCLSLSSATYLWVKNQLYEGKPVYIPNVSRLNAAAGDEKEILTRYGFKKFALIPIYVAPQTLGIIAVGNIRSTRSWDNAMFNYLRVISQIIATTLNRDQLDNALDEQHQFFKQVIDLNPNLIFAKDKLGRFTLANKAVADLYGTTVEDIVGKTDADFNPNLHEVEAFQRDDMYVMNTQHEKVIEEENITDIHGKKYCLKTVKRPIFDDSGEVKYVLGVSTDISERKQVQEKLAYDSLHDALTGLPNRALFMDRLESAIKRYRRRKNLFAVLFLDFDHFKKINDTMGHLTGDRVLVSASQKLATCLRSLDTVARFGGDEFVILLEDLNEESEAYQIAQRIIYQLNDPIQVVLQDVLMTVSIGIVFSNFSYTSPEDMLRDADIAMYKAKSLGKARYVVFNESMRTDLVDRIKIESDLRLCLESQQFTLHYQPIYSTKENRMIGVEALLRWQHPQRGFISPTEFIPIAEETDLIMPLGLWALREACSQMHIWHQKYPKNPPLVVSVNISTKQLSRPDFPDEVIKILEDTGLDPRQLKIEITESIFMENSETVTSVFEKLHEKGIEIYIDDFGMGYSSLGYLQRLSVNAIKIDRSFVNGLDHGDSTQEIVNAIIRLSQNLGMELIAEGVETIEQQNCLTQLGCKYQQGFLLSKPVDANTIETLLSHPKDEPGCSQNTLPLPA
jgi:diguanylate cyclase (GGDEF)-like protein/PAS domain S-box-containing protein